MAGGCGSCASRQFQVCHSEEKADIPCCGALWRDYDPQMNALCNNLYDIWEGNSCPVDKVEDYMFTFRLGPGDGDARYILDMRRMQQFRLIPWKPWWGSPTTVEQKRWVITLEGQLYAVAQPRRVRFVYVPGS